MGLETIAPAHKFEPESMLLFRGATRGVLPWVGDQCLRGTCVRSGQRSLPGVGLRQCSSFPDFAQRHPEREKPERNRLFVVGLAQRRSAPAAFESADHLQQVFLTHRNRSNREAAHVENSAHADERIPCYREPASEVFLGVSWGSDSEGSFWLGDSGGGAACVSLGAFGCGR